MKSNRKHGAVSRYFRKIISGEILFSGKRSRLGEKYRILKQTSR